jgi:hypothetical protein
MQIMGLKRHPLKPLVLDTLEHKFAIRKSSLHFKFQTASPRLTTRQLGYQADRLRARQASLFFLSLPGQVHKVHLVECRG